MNIINQLLIRTCKHSTSNKQKWLSSPDILPIGELLVNQTTFVWYSAIYMFKVFCKRQTCSNHLSIEDSLVHGMTRYYSFVIALLVRSLIGFKLWNGLWCMLVQVLVELLVFSCTFSHAETEDCSSPMAYVCQ